MRDLRLYLQGYLDQMQIDFFNKIENSAEPHKRLVMIWVSKLKRAIGLHRLSAAKDTVCIECHMKSWTSAQSTRDQQDTGIPAI